MQNENRKFLEFNGKNINVLAKDGQYWVGLKPVCEALGIDYEAELALVNEDFILKDELAELEVFEDGELQKVFCLPEKYVYGWVFMLEASSEGLSKFKEEANAVLFNRFN